jgi:ACT domain-containing protein
MLYHIPSVIRRLQESDKGLVTEKELLRLATPKINQINKTIELLQKAVRDGYVDACSIGDAAGHTGISRQTFYRWLDESIIQQDETGKVKISEILKTLKMIEKRNSGNV